MAENTSPVASPPLFLEVFCEVSCKDYRFTTGTKAEFAVSVINRKLGSLSSRVVYIEATKEGEEPISFGDDSFLVNYEDGWKLQTVTDADFPDGGHIDNADANDGILNPKKLRFSGTQKTDVLQRHLPQQFPFVSMDTKDSDYSRRDLKQEIKGDKSLRYMGRIVVAFVLMFIIGGLFTMALENLPRLILFFKNSTM